MVQEPAFIIDDEEEIPKEEIQKEEIKKEENSKEEEVEVKVANELSSVV